MALFIACGGDSDAGALTPSDARAVVPATGDAGPVGAASGNCGPEGSAIAAIERSDQRSFRSRPEQIIDRSSAYVATLRTDKGEITIDFAAAGAPVTVNNFVFLSCVGYFDGLTFHRYEPGFVIQGGDPRGDGTGGPGYIFDNETSPDLIHDAAGVIAMANSGPDTNGSQFYITLNPAPGLDGRYSVFGRVSAGMDVVRAIRAGDRILNVSIEER